MRGKGGTGRVEPGRGVNGGGREDNGRVGGVVRGDGGGTSGEEV